MTSSPIVKLDRITKRFGTFTAVDSLSLDIARGEFVTLLGASGCGKSTTLRMLGGFETPDKGAIVVDGQDVTQLPPDKRNVNMVFQDYALFPHLDVFRNVAFSLELRRLSREQLRKRVNELLELVHLAPLAHRLPHELSGGQRQRVALVRALAPDPSILLLDEPLGALDAKLRQQMQAELKALHATTGKTFLLVTHDQDEALFLSDRIVLMANGRIEQQGSPSELYEKPCTAFAASFLGEASFLGCRIASLTPEGAVADLGGRMFSVTQPGLKAEAGEALSLVLRPEWLEVAKAGEDDVITGRLVERKYRGSRLDLLVEISSGERVTVIHPRDTLVGEGGAAVAFRIRRGKGVLVDERNPHRPMWQMLV